LRKKGYSYEEIADKFGIAKSTAFLWTNKEVLNNIATVRLIKREWIGLKKANEVLKNKRNAIINKITNNVIEYLTSIKPEDKLLCSILYWAEGAKIGNNCVKFVNSDPF